MGVQSIRGAVETAIQRASSATGVDFGFLMRTARRESGYNPSAKAKGSSAAGLFQFIEQTWLATLKKHGARHGYARYAELIDKGSDGRYRVRGPEARQVVMDLRLDPMAASLMAGELAADHASYLRGRTGREPTAGELYAAHFLGPAGCAKLIKAVDQGPASTAAALFPQAAAANPSIFRTNGRAATVAEVYANLTATGGEGSAAPKQTSPAPQAPTVSPKFVQYASDRGPQLREQQEMLVQMILRGPQEPEAGYGGAMFDAAMLRALSAAQAKTRQV